MFAVLANRTYRHLFAAQVVALIGTGLMTVALGLLAYEIAGRDAGTVLGTALAIKMVAYIGVAPIVAGVAGRLPRRTFLVAMDAIRACVALALPFVDQVWQIYLLIFLLQSASAAFTPTFQASIPDVLPDERDYTRALSLSRLAYDLENLSSPLLAAALLTVVGFHVLFVGTVIGFIGSALLVVSVRLPRPGGARRAGGLYEATTRGLRIFLATPRLRGLLALDLSVAAAGALVIVDTVVLVRGRLGGSDTSAALALGCFGAGSVIAALALPRVLDRVPDRRLMLPAAAWLAVLLVAFSVVVSATPTHVVWPALLSTWLLLGIGYAAVQMPTGRLLRRSAHPADRPALFAGQFSLSHACWLITYPLAGWLAGAVGLPVTIAALGAITALGLVAALAVWPAADPEVLTHDHRQLPRDHPHLREADADGRHTHPFTIDDLHPAWPR